MLRNMNVGTKLLAVVLPPLVVLVVVAGIGARDRLDEAGDARTAEEYIALAQSSGEVIAELQRERAVSVYIAADPEESEALAEQREVTDAAVEAFRGRTVDVADDGPLAAAGSEALDRLGDLSTIRTSIDRGSIDPLIVHQWYIDSIARQLDLGTAVSNEVPFAEVSADLSSLVALTRAQEAVAQDQSILTIALANDEFDVNGRLWRGLIESQQRTTQYEDLYFAVATPEQSAELRGFLQGSDASEAASFRQAVVSAIAPTVDWLGSGEDYDADPNSITEEIRDLPASQRPEVLSPLEWIELSSSAIDARAEMGGTITDSVFEVVSESRSSTERQALLYLLVTAVAVIVSAVLALVVARKITRPLRHLTDAADRLSTEQLPALVERLKKPTPGSEKVLLEPIAMRRSDEIGHLADAFDAIQRVTVDVAEEQANLLKKGIGDIFVNLARRNQTLLDRQIEFIDQLESSEEDPDVLEDLFKLDHLATRMRRNAESLLVLAGVETGHRRSRPVPLTDVVRVAVGEVEDFARINLVSMDEAVVTGSAAMDVAHLLSELMENATSFSPPETQVEVMGEKNPDGTYVLSITDQGIGMSEQQLAETNRLLADPPLVGLSLSRSLGFTVVGRLAARFNIEVRLAPSPNGGLTALATLPASVLQDTSAAQQAPAPAASAPAPAPVAEAPAPAAEPTDEATPPEWITEAPAPASLATAVPEGDAFDAGLAALMAEESATESRGAESAPAEGPALFGAAPEEPSSAAPEPARTSAGLVKRVPRAQAPAAETAERPATEAPIARSQRSPEEVRAMLSRYRSGLHRGRDGEIPGGSSSDGSNGEEGR